MYHQNFKFQLNSNILNTINYFIKTNKNKTFQIIDQFTIINDINNNNNYIIQSIYKCNISSMLSVNMKLIHTNKKTENSINTNQLNEKILKQNKMIYFYPNKIICDTYFLCK